jgi:hypothetical protein
MRRLMPQNCTSLPGRQDAGLPRISLVAPSVAEVLEALQTVRAHEAFFTAVPPDVEILGEIPAPLDVEIPYREDILPVCQRRRGAVRIRIRCASLETREARCEALRRLSWAGIDCTIEDLNELAAPEARDLLGLFLHDPGIRRRIDPFAALLESLLRRRRCSLWDLCGPDPRNRIFVTGDGRAGATPAALHAGARADEFANSWKTFEDGQAVEKFWYRVPLDNPDCLACSFYCLCEGYGAWAKSCGTWRAVLSTLADAARSLRRRASCSAPFHSPTAYK